MEQEAKKEGPIGPSICRDSSSSAPLSRSSGVPALGLLRAFGLNLFPHQGPGVCFDLLRPGAVLVAEGDSRFFKGAESPTFPSPAQRQDGFLNPAQGLEHALSTLRLMAGWVANRRFSGHEGA